ncbi:hypothetical protein [Pseudocolwellia agarivorans]|uniref:hypothetical protein n=1 Tax=Pseudocolwellia agarivorans TaxID=1911682 RepID=UPI003F8850B9
MDDKKNTELRQLIDFIKISKLDFDLVDLVDLVDIEGEQPDFLAKRNDKLIGIELTTAYHPKTTKYQTLEMEGARAKYLSELKNILPIEARVIINVCFNEGVEVTKNDRKKIKTFSNLIVENSLKLNPVGTATYWNKHNQDHPNPKLSFEMPKFISNICLYKDGKHQNKVTGSSGGFLPDFNDLVLTTILESKNEKLKKYRECDEYWLVIVSNLMMIEAHNQEDAFADFGVTSFATSFGDINITKPINSNFDKTFLFKWPCDLILLG